VSVKYVPIQWVPTKLLYDAVLLAAVFTYIVVFLRLGGPAADATRPVDGAILRIRAFGSCAFVMLTLVLCIGPLARLDRRFLPLLYNRRHFGVLTAVVAATHATYVLGWYFAFAPTPPAEALLSSNTAYDRLLGFPFEMFGVFALAVLTVLAATSHDFWLSFLSAPVWKALHLLIYPAYGAVVAMSPWAPCRMPATRPRPCSSAAGPWSSPGCISRRGGVVWRKSGHADRHRPPTRHGWMPARPGPCPTAGP